MAKEAYLRSVVPAVSSARHGLSHLIFFDKFLELFACTMTSLIGMDITALQTFLYLPIYQDMHTVKYERNLQRI